MLIRVVIHNRIAFRIQVDYEQPRRDYPAVSVLYSADIMRQCFRKIPVDLLELRRREIRTFPFNLYEGGSCGWVCGQAAGLIEIEQEIADARLSYLGGARPQLEILAVRTQS